MLPESSLPCSQEHYQLYVPGDLAERQVSARPLNIPLVSRIKVCYRGAVEKV